MKFTRSILLLTAIILSLWMAWSFVNQVPLAGCAQGQGCEAAASSQFSHLLGLPVAMLGAVTYAALFLCWWLRAGVSVPPRLALITRFLSAVILCSALWFIGLQALHLHHFCTWCLVIHGCASLAVLLGWFIDSRRNAASAKNASPSRSASFLPAALAALCTVAAVAWTQFTFNANFGPRAQAVVLIAKQDQPAVTGVVPPVTAASDYLALHAGMLQLWGDSSLAFDPVNVPTVNGPADWAHRPASGVPVVLLHDWTCSHCRALHHALVAKLKVAHAPPAATAEPAATFLIPALPVWKDPTGESVHRLMLTAWFGARSFYLAAEHALLSGDLAPEPAAVEAFLSSRYGASWPVLVKNLGPSVDGIMQLGQRALTAAESHLAYSTLPVLISTSSATVGNPTAEQLDAFLSQAASTTKVYDVDQPRSAQLIAASTQAASTQAASTQAATQIPAVPPTPLAPSAVETNLSEITFDESSLTLEPVVAGAVRTAIFPFRNTGTEPLTITGVQVGCGCTVVNDWQQTVPPGQTGSIKADFNSAGRPAGMQMKTIVDRSNAKNLPMTTLSFSVEIVASASQPAAADAPVGTPAAGNPAAGSPAAGSPAAGSPAAGSPAAGSPAAGSPAAGAAPADPTLTDVTHATKK